MVILGQAKSSSLMLKPLPGTGVLVLETRYSEVRFPCSGGGFEV